MQDRIEIFIEACRNAGLKATHQRQEVYRELMRDESHPDAETLYRRVRERLPSISLDTVYRTLRTLEEHGLISRISTRADRARFDGNTSRHHHFVCERCGMARDFYDQTFDQLPIPDEAVRWGQAKTINVEVRGICAGCAACED